MSSSDSPTVRFGDVARQITDSVRDPLEAGFERYLGLEHLDPESLKVRRWGVMAEGNPTFTRVFRAGQVLFGKRRAYQRKAALADFDGVCSGDIIVMEAVPERLLPDLLPFIVQTEGFVEHALATSAGSLSPRTKWADLARYEFPLPPLDEQRRIADLLWAVEDQLENIRFVAEAVESLSHSYLASVLNRSGCERIKVQDIAKFSSGKSVNVTSLPKERNADSPYPVYGGNGIAGYTNTRMDGLLPRLVVIGRVGQQCGITRTVDSPCWITDNALYLQHIDERVNPDFLGLMLTAAKVNRSKIGNYLPLINQKVVESVIVPLPDLETQHAVVSKHEEIIKSKASSDAVTEHTAELRRAIISHLFETHNHQPLLLTESLVERTT